MKSFVGLITLAALTIFSVAATCQEVDEFSPWEDRSPPPPHTDYDYANARGDLPYGFSSWQDYAALVRTLAGGGAGGGGSAVGAVDLLADTDGDGEVTLIPTEITQPDGSTAGVIGSPESPLPFGSWLRFSDDGSVTVELP